MNPISELCNCNFVIDCRNPQLLPGPVQMIYLQYHLYNLYFLLFMKTQTENIGPPILITPPYDRHLTSTTPFHNPLYTSNTTTTWGWRLLFTVLGRSPGDRAVTHHRTAFMCHCTVPRGIRVCELWGGRELCSLWCMDGSGLTLLRLTLAHSCPGTVLASLVGGGALAGEWSGFWVPRD